MVELAQNPAKPPGIDGAEIGATVDWLEAPVKPGPAYESLFWRAFLGEPTFALLDVLRALDLDNDGRVEIPATIQELAALTGLGDRHTILGRRGSARRKTQAGALAVLETLGLISFSVEGPDQFHKKYSFLVATSLPMLTPEQVKTLPAVLRRFHERFMGVIKVKDPNYYTKLWRRHSKQRYAEFLLLES